MRIGKKALSVLLAGVFTVTAVLTQGSIGHAASIAFVDLEASHWAKESIDFAVEKGIVNGYYDEYSGVYSFRPENNVSYEEAATMLWRALAAAGIVNGSYTDEEKAALTERYSDVFEENDIAAWAQFFVADLLKSGILDESALPLFVGEEHIGNPAPRITVAVWTAKALNKSFAAAYYLPYTDNKDIAAEARPYVDMLYRHGIMRGSLQLDGSVAFLPNAGVKRCEFAAIANRVYESMSGGYDIAKEVYSYTSLDGLYLAEDFLLVADNGTSASLRTGSAADIRAVFDGSPEGSFVISGITGEELKSRGRSETGLPQLHVDTQPARASGKITSIDTITMPDGSSVTKLGIEISKYEVFYFMDDDTDGGIKLTKGLSVEFIADGVYLIEIR